MENRYEIHYDEIIPGTSCTYRSNGCTIIPLRIIRIHVYTIVSLMRRWLDTVAICFVGHRTQRRRMPSTRTPLNLRFMLERDFNDSLSPRHRNDSFSTNFFWEWRIHFHLFSCSQTLFPSQLLHHRSFLFIRFSIPHPPYRFFPPCLGNESVPRTGTTGIARR